MPSKVAVVIPVYKDELNPLEKISLAQCRKILSKYPIIFVAPEGKIFSYFETGDMIAHFPQSFFLNTDTYSKLLLSPQFYEPFQSFEYILIYQLDAFVFYDALEEFCSLGYDYIGAPWPYIAYFSFQSEKKPRVGNGGFSLRKVAACYELLSAASRLPSWEGTLEDSNEDAFFALCGATNGIDFNTAPIEVAAKFSMEHYPARCVKWLGGKLPFGCHGWSRFSADFYVEIFSLCGWDLRPLRNLMSSTDYTFQLPLGLTKLALTRLIRRIERGQSLIRYLPTKRFSSVRVIRNTDAMKILARLITEENFLADKIFVYDSEENLIRDMTHEKLPHLIIATDYDAPLIENLEGRGISYGRDFFSFRQEYLKACEKIFRKLGK